jgi:hypothetical protein
MSFAARLLVPAERLYDALIDPRRRERAMAWVLCGYALIWTAYGTLAKGSQSIHFDTGEMISWSRADVLGTPKHPPLGAWLLRLWFEVFPSAEWALYLFTMVSATIGLWAAWKVSQRYLDPGKCAAGLALLTLVPFYNFHALKYNANTAPLPFWALTAWWFLVSFETGGLVAAALAGIAAAAAMQSKYWSIFLLAGLVVAALADPRRGRYFRSAAPWVTVACGAAAFAPHVIWLFANDFPPFAFSVVHVGNSGALAAGLRYFPDIVAYIALPVVLAAAAARPSWAAVTDTVRPRDPARRTALLAFALPLMLPMLAILAQIAVLPLWTIPAMTLLPVVLLSSPQLVVPRIAAVRILVLAIVFPIAMVVAAPVIALVIHRRDSPNDSARYALVADDIGKLWRSASDRPLKIVGGGTNLANGVVFYLPDKPLAYEMLLPAWTPWIDQARIDRDGIAIVCRLDNANCIGAADRIAAGNPGTRQADVAVARRYFGIEGATGRYRIFAVPPRT